MIVLTVFDLPLELHLFSFVTGCLFGDPGGYHVQLEDIQPERLVDADCAGDTAKLSQQLLDIVFSKRELSKGNTTSPRRADCKMLDVNKLNAIRGELCFVTVYTPVNVVF